MILPLRFRTFKNFAELLLPVFDGYAWGAACDKSSVTIKKFGLDEECIVEMRGEGVVSYHDAIELAALSQPDITKWGLLEWAAQTAPSQNDKNRVHKMREYKAIEQRRAKLLTGHALSTIRCLSQAYQAQQLARFYGFNLLIPVCEPFISPVCAKRLEIRGYLSKVPKQLAKTVSDKMLLYQFTELGLLLASQLNTPDWYE